MQAGGKAGEKCGDGGHDWSTVIGHWSLVIGHWSLVMGHRSWGMGQYSIINIQ
jgi:hypothetical protein